MPDSLRSLLDGQLAYYRARASEYDRVYDERGDFVMKGPLVEELPIEGKVLELACGTGQWTTLLARRAERLTAVDGSPEMIAIARERVRAAGQPVEFMEADLFAWSPVRRYDTVFFAFWLSHVPPARFVAFWEAVATALAPGGRVVFVDTSIGDRVGEDVLDGAHPTVLRRLDDGSEHEIVKVFHDTDLLAAQLRELGWSASVRRVGTRFIAGVATRD
jgi:SAM-dependent methyltransferase